ncbi:MAG: TraX family protein [Rickettsiales bacterium]
MQESPTVFTTHHLLKVFAIAFMTIDHVGAYLYPDILWLRAIGRLAFPIFLFLIGSTPLTPFRKDILIWAVVMAVAQPLLGGALFPLNILFTILACQWMLQLVERKQLLEREPLMLCLACLILALPTALFVDYGTGGLLFALMGYAVRTGQIMTRRGMMVAVAAFIFYIGLQLSLLAYDVYQQVWIIVSMVLLMGALACYRYRAVHLPMPAGVAHGVLYLSRYALAYYVLHRVVLQGLGLAAGILHFGWRWMEM